jgi:hypothetical protein
MKKNTMKKNAISRRETIALLASGLFSLHDLNNFNYNTLLSGKPLKKMKSVIRNNGACDENDRHHWRHGAAGYGRS